MSDYSPPTFDSPNFNTSLFLTDGGGYLTLLDADSRYLRLSGGVVYGLTTFSNSLNVVGTLSINGSAIDLSLISGVTAGTPQASKALSLNSSSQIDGNLQFATSRKILMNNSSSQLAYIDMGNTASDRCISLFSDATSYYGFGANLSNLRSFSKDSFAWYTGATQSVIGTSIMTLNSAGLLTIASLTATTISGTLQTAAQPNITSVATLDITTHDGSSVGLKLGGVLVSATATELNYNTDVVAGTVLASSSVVVDSNKDITGFRRLSVGGTTGIMQINALTGGDAAIRLGSSEAVNKCWTIQYLTATNLLRFDAYGSNSSITLTPAGDLTSKASFDTLAYKLNGVSITMSSLTGITLGLAAPSKALTLDASSNITGINSLSTTTLNVSSVSSTSITQITTNANYSGVMDTASIVLKQASITNGNKIGIDFLISTNTIDNANTATCSITHERILAYVGDLIFNTKRTGTATAPLTEALRISSTGTCSIANTSSGFQLNLGASGTGINTNALTTTSLTLGATAITATGSELNYLDLTTGAGTAVASKALVLDASKNISTINSVTSNYLTINTAINSPAATANLSTLNLNGIATNYGVASIKGNATLNSPSFATTNSVIYMESSNATPITAEFGLSSGTGATSTNGLKLGTLSNNDFSLFTNAGTRMVIKANASIGLGSNASTADKTLCLLDGTAGVTTTSFRIGNTLTTNNCMSLEWICSGGSGSGGNGLHFNPYGTNDAMVINCNGYVGIGGNGLYPLDIFSYRTSTVVAPYALSESTTASYVASPNLSGQNISLNCLHSALFLEKVFISSDRRLKKNIAPINLKVARQFLNVQPVVYHKREQADNDMLNFGYIAQDIMKNSIGELLCHVDNDNMKIEEDGDIPGIQFNVQYDKVAPLLHVIVKEHDNIIEKLKSKINNLEEILKRILHEKC